MTPEETFEEFARLPADNPEAALDLYRRAYRAGAIYKSFVVTLTRQQSDPAGFMRELTRVRHEVDAERDAAPPRTADP